MKINEITIGQKVSYGSTDYNATGIVVAKGEGTFDILDELTRNVYRIASECIVATVENIIVEKVTPVEHPKSFSFEYVPYSMERNFSLTRYPEFFTTGHAHIKEENRWERDIRLPWSDKLDVMRVDKKYKVTVEEIL